MVHLKDNIEYPLHTNPFFLCVSCVIDPKVRKKMGGSGNGGIASTSQEFGNLPVVNHGDGEVKVDRQ
jgi:hypothetical protein